MTLRPSAAPSDRPSWSCHPLHLVGPPSHPARVVARPNGPSSPSGMHGAVFCLRLQRPGRLPTVPNAAAVRTSVVASDRRPGLPRSARLPKVARTASAASVVDRRAEVSRHSSAWSAEDQWGPGFCPSVYVIRAKASPIRTCRVEGGHAARICRDECAQPMSAHRLACRHDRAGMASRPADVAAIVAFGSSVVPPHYAPISARRSRPGSWPGGPQNVRARPSKPAGCTWRQTATPRRGVETGELAGRQVIWKLYLAPDHRGRSLGPELLRHAIAGFPWTATRSSLSTSLANTRAAAFYEREGFEIVKIEPRTADTPEGIHRPAPARDPPLERRSHVLCREGDRSAGVRTPDHAGRAPSPIQGSVPSPRLALGAGNGGARRDVRRWEPSAAPSA